MNAQASHFRDIALQKEKDRQEQEERELRDMINGSKQVPIGADKMLKLIKEEQDLETPRESEASL